MAILPAAPNADEALSRGLVAAMLGAAGKTVN